MADNEDKVFECSSIKQIGDSSFAITIISGKSCIEAAAPSSSPQREVEDIEDEIEIESIDFDYDSREAGGDSNEGQKLTSTIDKVQTALDVAGFFPAFGAIPDLVNGLIYTARGDFANAGLSFVAAIPLYGDAVAGVSKGVKYVAKGIKTTNQGLKRIKVVRGVKKFKIKGKKSIRREAKKIVEDAQNHGKTEISFLWTNGTYKKYAEPLYREIKRKYPNMKVNIFEQTPLGKNMVKTVNNRLASEARKLNVPQSEIDKSLRKGTLWTDFFDKWAKDKKYNSKQLMNELQSFQREQSTKYYDFIHGHHIIEVRKYGQRLGQGNKAELIEGKILGREAVDGVIIIPKGK